MQVNVWLPCVICGLLLGCTTVGEPNPQPDTTIVTYEGEARGEKLERAKAAASQYCRMNFGRAAMLEAVEQREGRTYTLFKCR